MEKAGRRATEHWLQLFSKSMWTFWYRKIMTFRFISWEIGEKESPIKFKYVSLFYYLDNRSLTDDQGDLLTEMVGKKSFRTLNALVINCVKNHSLNFTCNFICMLGENWIFSKTMLLYRQAMASLGFFFFSYYHKIKSQWKTENTKENVYVFVRCSHTFWNAK